MSSCLTSYAQVIPKVKNSTVSQVDPNADLLLHTFKGGQEGDIYDLTVYPESAVTNGLAAAKAQGYSFTQVGSVIDTKSEADLIAITTKIGDQDTIDLSGGSLMRDLGKFIDMKINGLLAARLRLTELVDNAEGYGHSGRIFYLLTYCSTPFVFDTNPFITCARTGSCPQKLPNSQYFVVALEKGYQDLSGYIYYKSSIPNGLANVDIPYSQIGSVINTNTVADMNTLYNQVYDQEYDKIPLGALLKDMGKTVDFTVNGMLALRWTLVQRVNGAATEGVPEKAVDGFGNDTNVGYIVTYCADQSYYDEAVVCVRTGSSLYNSPETQFFINPFDLSGSLFLPELVYQDIQTAINAGVNVTQNGSNYDTPDLSSMISLYDYVKAHRQENPSEDVPQFIVRDMGKNIDFTINGQLAIRLRLVQVQFGIISEGVPDVLDSTFYNVVFTPVFVSDQVVFDEIVGVARTG